MITPSFPYLPYLTWLCYVYYCQDQQTRSVKLTLPFEQGNAVMGAAGGPAMAKLVKQALSQCPKTKVLLGGYSQGAMVVHNAANSLSADQITAAVLFGDPLKAQSVGQVAGDKVKEFCHLGDPVCLNGVNGMAHITYGTDAAAAGKFLIEAAGGSSTSS